MEESNVDVAAVRLLLLLADWVENSRSSRSASEKTVDELVRDFGLSLI